MIQSFDLSAGAAGSSVSATITDVRGARTLTPDVSFLITPTTPERIRLKRQCKLGDVLSDAELAVKPISPIIKVRLDLESILSKQQHSDLAAVGYHGFGIKVLEYYTTQFANGCSPDLGQASSDLACGQATLYRALRKLLDLGYLIKKGTSYEPSNNILELLAVDSKLPKL